MSGLHFDITGDNTNLMEKLKEIERGVKSTSASIQREGGSIEQLFSRMSKAASAFGAGFTAKELIQNIVQVRGEFQQLEVAFITMLGSQEKANALMSQLTDTAAKTPFDLQGVANGARQLLAYGTAVDDVNETLIRLGNIAAGLSIPLNDLVYLYGTTMTQGRLYTQDLNQFTGRGIPMIRELAKEFGVAETEVKKLVESGKVGFPEVQKVIQNLTNEGGMFFNLMQEQSKTITGQISNIEDNFSMMLNNIGKANEGIINDVLGGVSYLIESYETVGRTLLEIVGTYGAYKAALITITALQKAYSAILAQSALNQSLAAASGVTLSNAQALAATRTKLLQVAQAALNKTLLFNPYVAAAAAVASLGLGIYKLITYQTEAEKAQERLNKVVGEVEGSVSQEMASLRELNKKLTEATRGTEQWKDIKEQIVKGYSQYLSNIDQEIEKTGNLSGKYNELEKAIRKSTAARSLSRIQEQEDEKYQQVREKNMEEAYNYMINTYGDKQGLEYYRGWLNWLDKDIDEDTPAFVQKAYEKGGLNFLMQEIRNQDKLRRQTIQRYQDIFGISDADIAQTKSSTENGSSTENKTYEEAYDAAEARWKAAVKAVQDAKRKSEADYKKAVQEEEEARKSFAELGGDTKGKGVKSENQILAQQSRVDELLDKQSQARIRQQVDLENQVEQARIDAMADGAEKVRDQRELDNKKELEAIERQKEEYKQKVVQEQKEIFEAQEELKAKQNPSYKKKSFDASSVSVDTSAFDLIYGYTQTRQANDQIREQERAWNEYLIRYGTFQQKRRAIIEKYDREIAEAQTAGDTAIKTEEKKAALKQLDEQYGKSTRAMADLFEDASQKSVASIQQIIDKYELLVKYLSGTKQSDGTTITADELKAAGFTDSDIEKIERGEISIRDVTDALKGLKEELKGKSPWQSFASDMQKGIGKLKAAAGDSKKVGEGITDIGNAVASFAPVLGEFANNIASIFGADDTNITEIAGAIGGLGQAAAGVGQIMSGDIIGGIMGAVGGISSIVSSIAQIHDKKNEKQIQRLQDRVDALADSYDRLGEEADRSYSVDSAKAIDEQNRNLASQNALISQQIREEEKKKSIDDERIKQWTEQIAENNRLIEENKRKRVEAIAGTSIMSAIDEFAQAYADAWASGEDAAKASMDVVKNLIKTSLLEFLKKQLSPDVEEFMKNLAIYMSDGIISPWEKAQLDKFAERMDQKAESYFDQTSGYWEDGDEGQQSATSRGFETMTQDQESGLSGRFTAMYEVELRIHDMLQGFQMLTSSADQRNTLLSDIRNLAVSSNSYLEDIASWQKKICTLLNANIPDIRDRLRNL